MSDPLLSLEMLVIQAFINVRYLLFNMLGAKVRCSEVWRYVRYQDWSNDEVPLFGHACEELKNAWH